MTPRLQPLCVTARIGCLLLAAACAGNQTVCERTAPPLTHAGEPPALPALDADKAKDLPGLHNVVAYADGLFSGAVPEGEEGFETLHALGVTTVVSVDGAIPDVEAAERHGIRYIHLPISYDTVPELRTLQLAQVVANAKGPLYMHCHHGKHRSAGAVAAAAVVAGKLTPAAAEQRMKVSGTSAAYSGLWSAVRNAHPADAAQLRSDLSAFPKTAQVSGMVGTMAELDVVFDLVKLAAQNRWQAPAFHPDLVAKKETARMHGLFARLEDDADSKQLDQGYQRLLQQAIDLTARLHEAVDQGDHEAASGLFHQVGKSCKECHKTYRDQ